MSIILCLLACSGNRQHPISNIITELRNGNLVERSYFFYPSIMRVFNLKDNPDYYDLIRDIRKLGVFRMSDEFSLKDAGSLRLSLLQEEYFEEYVVVNLQGQRIYFLGKEDPSHSILLISTEEEYYIVDIVGQIDFWSLNKLARSMASDSSSTDTDFLDVFSLIGIEREEGDVTTDSVSVDTLRPDTDPELIIKE